MSRLVSLRVLESADVDWVVRRHGAVYWDEYRWNSEFETLVREIAADYFRKPPSPRQSAWMADVDGVPAGCVFLCERDAATAQLRLLLVEKWARGLRIGSQLVQQCVSFARTAEYQQLVLWTNDVLGSARRIYERAGFELVDEARHFSFGQNLVGQNWQLDLA